MRDHAPPVVDGDEPDGIFADAGDDGGFVDAVVSMRGGENDKALVIVVVVVVVAGAFGGWVEVATGGDEAGEVTCATAGDGDAAGEFTVKTKEVGEAGGGDFFEDGQGGGDGVDVDVCV